MEGLQEKQKAIEDERLLYSTSFIELREGVTALARDVSSAVVRQTLPTVFAEREALPNIPPFCEKAL